MDRFSAVARDGRSLIKQSLFFFLQVVLASTPDLQCGYSRDLFVAWCGNAKNSIVLTNRTSPGTLARWLIDNPQDHVVRLEVSVGIIKLFLVDF
ncbi:cleavage and polyadenylation specificity factor subunit 2 [Elysia marginata]|uniref:Cleavage and polyadenylation specificity factor subunit 2 n=1 Tax=Elysia marginata TaxID=1093978 RepID=A0AAV4HNN0_9GAST|nr:cleavage and polyadenylation specificity factor subunit 2 [Elysia marginata]